MLNSKSTNGLYKNNVSAKKILDYMTLNAKDQEKFYANVLAQELELPRKEVIDVFKLLETKCGVGAWLRGRVAPGRTRFEAVYKMADVEKAMHNAKYEAGMPYRESPKKPKVIPAKILTAVPPVVVVPEVVAPPVVTPEVKAETNVLQMHRDAKPILETTPLMNTLVIRPGFVLQIPSGLSETERKRVADFIQIAN